MTINVQTETFCVFVKAIYQYYMYTTKICKVHAECLLWHVWRDELCETTFRKWRFSSDTNKEIEINNNNKTKTKTKQKKKQLNKQIFMWKSFLNFNLSLLSKSNIFLLVFWWVKWNKWESYKRVTFKFMTRLRFIL